MKQLLHLLTSLHGTSQSSRPDPAKSAYEGQSGHTADIVRGPTLTPTQPFAAEQRPVAIASEADIYRSNAKEF
jgi:hypothetical protein